ncbi:MAG TPA: energy transducer TonB [Rhodocyclaceae bacterium]|nr:energy transducer TonB [Rhodocyclaceae bacterium]
MERQYSPGKSIVGRRFIAASAFVHLLAFTLLPGPPGAAEALRPLLVQLRSPAAPAAVAAATEAVAAPRPPARVAAPPEPTPPPTLLTRTEPPAEALPAVAIASEAPPAPVNPPTVAALPAAVAAAPAVAELAAAPETRERRGKPSTLWLANYTKTISGQVGRLKQYPSIARLRGWQGTAVISILLAADGTILQVRVEQSSGHDVLDSQALAMVRQAEPLPPYPGQHDGDPLTVRLPIVFALANS